MTSQAPGVSILQRLTSKTMQEGKPCDRLLSPAVLDDADEPCPGETPASASCSSLFYRARLKSNSSSFLKNLKDELS